MVLCLQAAGLGRDPRVPGGTVGKPSREQRTQLRGCRRTQTVLHHGHRWEELLGGVVAHWLLRYLLPPLLGVGNSPAVRVDSLLQSQLLLSLPEHVSPGLVEVSVELVTVRGFMVTCRSTRKQAQEIN